MMAGLQMINLGWCRFELIQETDPVIASPLAFEEGGSVCLHLLVFDPHPVNHRERVVYLLKVSGLHSCSANQFRKSSIGISAGRFPKASTRRSMRLLSTSSPSLLAWPPASLRPDRAERAIRKAIELDYRASRALKGFPSRKLMFKMFSPCSPYMQRTLGDGTLKNGGRTSTP